MGETADVFGGIPESDTELRIDQAASATLAAEAWRAQHFRQPTPSAVGVYVALRRARDTAYAAVATGDLNEVVRRIRAERNRN